MTDSLICVPAGVCRAKLGVARRGANSSAIREEVGGDPAPRQARHPWVRKWESVI
jgi:hypothetical protein